MRRFPGFPGSAEATAIPNAFFSGLLPLIDDTAELTVSLYLFYALARRRYPRFVSRRELEAEEPLGAALTALGCEPKVAIASGLERAVARGGFLALRTADGEQEDVIYVPNSPSGRRDLARIRAGLVPIGRRVVAAPRDPEPPASIYRLYEDTIGTLTPSMARELEEAEGCYPTDWLEEAFRQAARHRARSWSYVRAILERWSVEGREDEEAGRPDPAVDIERRYLRGRYGQYLNDG